MQGFKDYTVFVQEDDGEQALALDVSAQTASGAALRWAQEMDGVQYDYEIAQNRETVEVVVEDEDGNRACFEVWGWVVHHYKADPRPLPAQGAA